MPNDVSSIVGLLQVLITAIAAVIASSGFWAYINHKKNKPNLLYKLVIGLAHDRIVCLALRYIDAGYITQDEYDNLHSFLFEPYIGLGGNGTAIRLMKEVDGLPIISNKERSDILKDDLPEIRRKRDDY